MITFNQQKHCQLLLQSTTDPGGKEMLPFFICKMHKLPLCYPLNRLIQNGKCLSEFAVNGFLNICSILAVRECQRANQFVPQNQQ